MFINKNLISGLLLLLLPLTSSAKLIHLLPRPKTVEIRTGFSAFPLNKEIRIESSCPEDRLRLKKFILCHDGIIGTRDGLPVIKVCYAERIDGTNHSEEAYLLDIDKKTVCITVTSPVGVIRAIQTMTQLAEGYKGKAKLEALRITDYPSFKIRGYMHDVGRSFLSVEELKKEINLLSRFKINVFHWHLTENQGWRLESKKYPQLRQNRNFTRYPGLYYTLEQAAEIERYCREHGVMLIPEIDMPGHSAAFERAFNTNMQTDKGVEILKELLTEACGIFKQSPYIHIGGDEVTITYPNFLGIMIEHVHQQGKKVVLWNRAAGGFVLDKNCGADMTQMWATAGKAVAGLPNIDCRYNYANHFDTYADIVGIYKSNIYYVREGNDDVAGAIVAFWNDRKLPTQEAIIKQNNFYAAVLATGERAWCGGGEQYIEKGGTMLPAPGTKEFNEFADWEQRFLFHKTHSLKNEPIPYVKQTNVHWRITDAFPNDGDINKVLPPEIEGPQKNYTYQGKTYHTTQVTGAGIYLRHTWGTIIPAFYAHPQNNHTAYAYTYVYSPKQQTLGAQIEFQNYGRSEQDYAPDSGMWDRKGSRLWVNDREIIPPVWNNTGKTINNEIDLGNENFTGRTPLLIELKRGWNKVFMKLPFISSNGNRVRLQKWMFTFVFTTLDGKKAPDDIIYSPDQLK